ncbi:unnamed protein product [Arctia plantaginis]|uniref:Uncharacterized protein n=1 Tax=Arctia plantaginis TaxID=874455 RepID=A0A8S0ZR62_ARCPL|nr:unnamed protein product [Arctia plantaginis]
MKQIIELLVLLCCELCLTIKVPTTWNESANSAVSNEPNDQDDSYKQQNIQTLQQSQSIPIDYFQYTAKKPQFAIDVAAFHGVKNPEQHYKAYPIIPYTGKEKPVLGIHHLLNEDRNIYQPYQKYVQKVEGTPKYVSPMSASYEVFHPYKAEVPALQELYKDPILNKIRNDLHDSKNRLQAYEQDAGRPNIADDEYLEKIKYTDSKLFPQKNVPAHYEIHRPERRPTYYRIPPRDTHREHVLNQRFKHPWNEHSIKIRPLHYKPLKNHLYNLRQQHAMKYDDEQNEYPQLQLSENIAQQEDGYDIYEKGKQKYTQLRNNLDESINKAVLENRPETYQKLEIQPNESTPKEVDDEFIPVKNYAQVRKTETIKHLPKKAAFDDADTYEEILNAPRLREAIKSTKAQIVYSEEGYEDSAYDHAGEQKHALDHEGHGGFLKETAKSGGLFKTPSFSGSYQDGKGSEHRDNIEHEKKWENNDTDNEEEIQAEDYSENEYDESADAYKDKNLGASNRNKREDQNETKFAHINNHENAQNISDIEVDKYNNSLVGSKIHIVNKSHEVDKRETSFEIPTINLDKTYLSESEILKIAKQKIKPIKDNIRDKYPYYFKKFKSINEHSPLRYAENLKSIPKKSAGGTEFYDSRSKLECPEVEEDIDPIPEKLRNGNNPTKKHNDEEERDESNHNTKENNTTLTNKPRLNGLGDKIDCFKAKYFGENPLDSPFFKEDIISIPKPLLAPKLSIFDHLKAKQKLNYQNLLQEPDSASNTDIFVLLNKLRINDKPVQEFQQKLNESSQAKSYTPKNTWAANNTEQNNVYTDILTNIRNEFDHPHSRLKEPTSLLQSNKEISNKTYNFFQNIEEVTKLPPKLRRKRASQFVYEPYKIIRDSQYQDSKKTTTTSNISPLIRQLQTSRVVDRVSRSNRDDYKPNPKNSSRNYVNIGKNDRVESNGNPTIVDVSVDQRRGEPRYEIRLTNHKSEYTPVENRRAMSIDDYNTHTNSDKTDVTTVKSLQTSSTSPSVKQHFRYATTTVTPVYDVASFLPNSPKVSPSNAVRRIVATTTPTPISKEIERIKEISGEDTEENDEDYNYDDDEDDEEENSDEMEPTTTTTTTTTLKPAFRRRTQVSTTTENTNNYNNEDQPERLKLVTRFRNYKPREKQVGTEATEPTNVNKYKLEKDSTLPKYTEKKKKSSESTVVTDTKKYGDDDDDIDDDVEEKEIDAMIGVKHNIKDYMPSYEQEMLNKARKRGHYEEDDDEEEEEEDEEGDDNGGGYDDEEEGDETIADDEEDDEEEETNETKLKATTPGPTKRTLGQPTEAPPPTVASDIKTSSVPLTNLKLENKPLITRKKIEIHKELPVNKSGPHVTQFKQDIKEVEIIKEMPSPKRKLHRKVEPLELYKDEKLAKDINKLEDIEVFRENLELEKGPRHGGNYRRASKEDLKLLTLKNRASDEVVPPKDVEASQSENRKRVELDEFTPQRVREDNQHSLRGGKTGKNAELVELSNSPGTGMHGGNLKHKGRGSRKSEKLIELDDDPDDDDSTQDDDYKSSPHNSRHDRLHGGNYRSAKLVVEKPKNDDIKVNNPSREARRSATILLNRFVQAVPALTTTPGYIVDPSKRMYYYLDV